ncbi:MAG TPA: BON domain-containing protein [Methylomirabilota bacterium]|nr:BON domain-containing protein [Methylomirabilota bacterium]
MGHAVLVVLALLQAGCITAAAWTTYEVATDERSVERQHLDTEIAITIKTRLLESPVPGSGWVEVYCRHGVVILTGVVENGSQAGREAIAIARRVEGVKRIETYFVPSRPSVVSDYAIKLKLSARVVWDWDLRASQVSSSVLGGHVVLVGVVDHPDKVKRIVGHAQATGGVVAVKSFIQIAEP